MNDWNTLRIVAAVEHLATVIRELGPTAAHDATASAFLLLIGELEGQRVVPVRDWHVD